MHWTADERKAREIRKLLILFIAHRAGAWARSTEHDARTGAID